MRTRASVNKKEGVPTEERVDDIFFAIIPDFPTPDNIILPFFTIHYCVDYFIEIIING